MPHPAQNAQISTQYRTSGDALPRTPIVTNSRIVGTVVGSEFQKTIHTKHFLKQPPAIAFDIASLDAAEEAGARAVRITHFETRDEFFAPIAQIRQQGVRFNRGYGDQVALPLAYWIINGREQPTPQEPASEPEAMQLSLWGAP
jgi:hypothetical protein